MNTKQAILLAPGFAAALGCMAALTALRAEAETPSKTPAFVRELGVGDDKTYIQADRAEYELDSGWVSFFGNVAISYKGMELRSDNIRYNQKTGEAQAKGKVVLAGSDGSLWQGEKLDINIKKESGKANKIDIYSEPFRVLADKGTMTEDKTYLVENATVTTCTNEPGHFHYKLRASKLRLRPKRDLTAWGAVPSLFGVPFFYFPYYWKDLKRHYGFRFEPGYQSSWGPYLLSSYKLPLYRNKQDNVYVDSKTSLDWRAKRGYAYGERVSWKFQESATGWLSGYYLEDDDPPSAVEDPERYRIRLNQSWNATDRDQFLAQALYVSDDRFMENFFEDEYRSMNQPDNYLAYTHLADSYSYGALGRVRLNDFYTQVERLPEAWFNLNSTELGEGVYIENASTISFLNKEFDERTDPLPDAYDAMRMDSRTMLSRPYKLFGFLNVIPRGGYRATYYSKTVDHVAATAEGSTVATNLYGDAETVIKTENDTTDIESDADLRSVFELGTEVSLKAYGLYQDSTGNIWRHVFEPYSNYTFIPEPNLVPDQLYQFDEVDEIDKFHNVRLGTRNRWQIKPRGGTRTHERIYLDFYTDVNVEPEDDEENIESFNIDTRYTPNSWLRFEFEAQYDVDPSQIDNAAVRLTAWHQIFSTDFEYRYRVDDSSLLRGSLTWHFNGEWSASGYGRYEFETSQVEEIGSWIERRWDCIAFRFYASVKPGYGMQDDGSEEDDDYKFAITAWLTDFTPDRIREDGWR